jgi:hypothetical protein
MKLFAAVKKFKIKRLSRAFEWLSWQMKCSTVMAVKALAKQQDREKNPRIAGTGIIRGEFVEINQVTMLFL